MLWTLLSWLLPTVNAHCHAHNPTNNTSSQHGIIHHSLKPPWPPPLTGEVRACWQFVADGVASTTVDQIKGQGLNVLVVLSRQSSRQCCPSEKFIQMPRLAASCHIKSKWLGPRHTLQLGMPAASMKKDLVQASSSRRCIKLCPPMRQRCYACISCCESKIPILLQNVTKCYLS